MLGIYRANDVDVSIADCVTFESPASNKTPSEPSAPTLVVNNGGKRAAAGHLREPRKHASQGAPIKEGRTMAMDEGIELESVKAPLSEAGDLMSLWQDDDGSVGLAFASGVKPEAWSAMLVEAIV